MFLLARFTGPDLKRARSLGLWLNGKRHTPVEFDLAGTPGGGDITEAPIVYPSGVAALFPANRFVNEQDMESYVGVTFFDSSGKPLGQAAMLSRRPLARKTALITSVLQIIAGRVAAEIERQEGERMFRDLFEHAPDATILVDQRGLIAMSNGVAHRMFGYTAGEMVGLPVERLMPESARAGHEKLREKFHHETTPRAMGSGRPNLLGLRRDLVTFPVDISLSPIATPKGPGAIAAIRDMTEQRIAEARSRKSQKLESLGQLAGGIAHDFNNILSGILGFAELSLMDLPPGQPLRANLLRIQQAGLRARSLVAQILAVSRPSTPELSQVQLGQIIREVFELLRPSLPVTIEMLLPKNLDGHVVLADPTQIHQVLMNLCTNAWQALPDKRGRIVVDLTTVDVDAKFATDHPPLHPGPHVRISVSDNGSGMSAATLEHIFDPFFTTKAVGKGTGLGLAVTYGIVKAHHGAIGVHSALGIGTTFEVYFPAHHGSILAMPIPKPGFSTLGHGQRILLVDDDELTGPVLNQVLERLGYSPVLFKHPGAALAELAAGPTAFALVLTDMTMPDMTGVDLAAAVRRYNPDLPVLLTTGLATTNTRELAEQAGVREILLKPLSVDQISAALGKHLATT